MLSLGASGAAVWALAGSGCPPGVLAFWLCWTAALPPAPARRQVHLPSPLPTAWASSPTSSSCLPAHRESATVTELSFTPPSWGLRLVLSQGRGGLLPSTQLPPFSGVCSGAGSLRRDCGLVGTVIAVSRTVSMRPC